jgi:hypothetical protein
MTETSGNGTDRSSTVFNPFHPLFPFESVLQLDEASQARIDLGGRPKRQTLEMSLSL